MDIPGDVFGLAFTAVSFSFGVFMDLSAYSNWKRCSVGHWKIFHVCAFKMSWFVRGLYSSAVWSVWSVLELNVSREFSHVHILIKHQWARSSGGHTGSLRVRPTIYWEQKILRTHRSDRRFGLMTYSGWKVNHDLDNWESAPVYTRVLPSLIPIPQVRRAP